MMKLSNVLLIFLSVGGILLSYAAPVVQTPELEGRGLRLDGTTSEQLKANPELRLPATPSQQLSTQQPQQQPSAQQQPPTQQQPPAQEQRPAQEQPPTEQDSASRTPSLIEFKPVCLFAEPESDRLQFPRARVDIMPGGFFIVPPEKLRPRETFECGWSQRVIRKEPHELTCVLREIEDRGPFRRRGESAYRKVYQEHESGRDLVRFYQNTMYFTPEKLLLHSEVRVECHRPSATVYAEAQWDQWNILGWPTDPDGQPLTVGRHFQA
ncbi:hypothetical protein FB446DRAFT_260671 [Lentinula raphanica]|nr:hypothetical protein FB446DRAFT_260671 [Lentinula raphanica]